MARAPEITRYAEGKCDRSANVYSVDAVAGCCEERSVENSTELRRLNLLVDETATQYLLFCVDRGIYDV